MFFLRPSDDYGFFFMLAEYPRSRFVDLIDKFLRIDCEKFLSI